MAWNRGCGGGYQALAPGRRAEEWSLSGWPLPSLAHARWRHTNCQSPGCRTCCRQRSKAVSPRQCPGRILEIGEERG